MSETSPQGQSEDDLAQRRPRSRNMRPLRALLPFVWRYPAHLTGALIALVVATAAALAMPFAVRLMIDEGFSVDNAAAIDRYFLMLLVVAIVLGLASAARFYFVTWLGEKVTNDLRYQVYDHILTLSAAFFERSRTGELVSRLTADTTLIRTIIGSSASIALRNAFLFVGASAMLVVTSASLSFYVALTLPALVLPLVIVGRLVRRRARLSQDKLAAASAMIAESLPAMQLVQAFTHEPEQRRQFAASLKESFAAARGRIIARATMTALAIILVFSAVVVILWLGASQMLAGAVSAGVLGQFVLYAVLCAGAMGALSEVWGEVQMAAGATERLTEILLVQPAIQDAPRARQLSPHKDNARSLPAHKDIAIRFEDVHFAYPSRTEVAALEGVSLTVPPGTKCALVGASGAGKSTMFQLLLRFYDPQRGRIMLGDVALMEAKLESVRRSMAIVPQETILFAGSVRDNIRFGKPQADERAVREAAEAARADEFIRELPEGYDTELGERGVNLSGGQRQRLAIARAILRDAPILLLDEATNALDAKSERLVQDALARLLGARTSMIIAHRLATVRDADHIAMMERGRLVAQGSHEQLLREHEGYAELVRLQFTEPQAVPTLPRVDVAE